MWPDRIVEQRNQKRQRRRKPWRISGWAIWLMVGSSCIEPYNPELPAQSQSVLVIDGFMDINAGSAVVRLTHTTSLQDAEGAGEAETNAQVMIAAADGTEYALSTDGFGTYYVYGIIADPGQTYRLYVRTSNADEFISDPLAIRSTPEIDSVTWTPESNGVTVNVNTHDPTGNSRYYRWDYVETWLYRAPVASDYTFYDRNIVYRTDSERITVCWKTVTSTDIVIGSSARLTDDIISQHPVKFVPVPSSELSNRYSILVRQRVIEKAEYSYLEQLKKSTESIGGLFDPQPSQAAGNIHGVNDSSLPVLGYFSAGTYTEKRLFINLFDLPRELQKVPRYFGCAPDSVMIPDLPNISSAAVIGSAIYNEAGFVIGYTVTSPECADCRVQGGTTTKPDFW